MKDNDIERLIDFVLKDAFEGLMDSDQWSVEKAIRTWFKVEKNARDEHK
jgi:hypothetical protein